MSYKNTWTAEDEKRLGVVLALCFKNSDAYGTDLNLADRVAFFKECLQDLYTVDQILTAIKTHSLKSSEMVKPCHVHAILNPVREITTAEFIHAKEQWKNDGYPVFSRHKDVVKAYEAQSMEKTEPLPITILEEAKKQIKQID